MAPCSSIIAWEIPCAEEPGGPVHEVTELDTTERLSLHVLVWYIQGI